MSGETLDWQYTCRGRAVFLKKEDGEHELMGFLGCGHLLNPQIDAVPRDGVLHWIECEKCGTPIPVTKTPYAEDTTA